MKVWAYCRVAGAVKLPDGRLLSSENSPLDCDLTDQLKLLDARRMVRIAKFKDQVKTRQEVRVENPVTEDGGLQIVTAVRI